MSLFNVSIQQFVSHDGHVSGHPPMWPVAVILLVVRGDVDADFVEERAKHGYAQESVLRVLSHLAVHALKI